MVELSFAINDGLGVPVAGLDRVIVAALPQYDTRYRTARVWGEAMQCVSALSPLNNIGCVEE